MLATNLPSWEKLVKHQKKVKDTHLRELFRQNPNRSGEFSVEVGDIYLDYSKNRITHETLDLLLELAKEAKVEEARTAMFRGDAINTSENRPVLHTALRNQSILFFGFIKQKIAILLISPRTTIHVKMFSLRDLLNTSILRLCISLIILALWLTKALRRVVILLAIF